MGNLNTEQLLAERGKTHGEYSEHARATQNILRAMQAERGWPTLSDMQKETVHMIAHKLGRIVTGNPDVADHWDDIAGYSRLISQRLENPIPPIDINEDPYMAMAVAWNCSREEAKARAIALNTANRYRQEGETLSEAAQRLAKAAVAAPSELSPAQQAMLDSAALRAAQESSDDYAKAV